MRGLASKFVHLFISTLHFPNQVFCSLWLSCSKVPSCNSLSFLFYFYCLNHYSKSLIIISYFEGRGIRLQRSTAVLDNRQRHCLPIQYFSFWWGMRIIYWKWSPAVEERLLGRQNALWCAGCCETVLGSLRSYWWCWLQVHFYNDQLWLKSTFHWPDTKRTNPQPGRTDFNKTKSSTRKNIFIFLSNTGGKEITDAALSTWREGKPREEISFAQVSNLAQMEMLHWKFLSQLEPLIAAGAFNEAGGLQFSRVIERSLVDVFVPFLPLERTHVRTCVHNELQRRGLVAASEVGFFRWMNSNSNLPSRW